MKLKTTVAVLSIFLYTPIWFYILHEILERVNATELMWFLFYAYIPLSIIISALMEIDESK